MKSFVIACLVAAATQASYVHPWAKEAKASEAKAIISQVATGFEAISKNNSQAEAKAVDHARSTQEADTKAILDEANQEASEILEQGKALGRLDLDLLDEVYADRTEEINAVNVAHDEDVANIAKQHVVAEVANETVKADLIDDLETAKDAGLDVSSLVQEAELPFDVDTDLKPDDVLERIEKREGEDIEAIKNDEEFDVFLARILQQFEESKEKPDSPDSPENDFETPESPYTPTAPESEQSPDEDEFVHEPENPGNPGAPDFRGDKPSRPSEIDVDTSVPYEPESPESPEALTNDFDSPVAPEGPVRPPSPKSPKGRSRQPVVSIVSTKVVASDDDDMDGEDAPSCSLHKDEVEPEVVRAF